MMSDLNVELSIVITLDNPLNKGLSEDNEITGDLSKTIEKTSRSIYNELDASNVSESELKEDIDGVVLVNEDVKEENSTLNITEYDSSLPVSSTSLTRRKSLSFKIKMDNFRELIQSARSNNTLKPALPFKHESLRTDDNEEEPYKEFNVTEHSSTIRDSFRLDVLDMSEPDDDFYDGRIIIHYDATKRDVKDRSAKPLPLFFGGDQVFPDEFDLTLSLSGSDIEDDYVKDMYSSKFYSLNKKDFEDYEEFNQKNVGLGLEDIEDTTNDVEEEVILSPPPTSSHVLYPIERGLRLLTSASSLVKNEESIKIAEEVLKILEARRFKEKTINHNDFEGFGEGDLECLFKEKEPKVIPVIKNDVKGKPESKFLKEASTKTTTTTFVKHYSYEESDLSSESGGLISAASLLEIFANNLEKDFSATSDNLNRKRYHDLKNKDDWIDSLNSAFKIDEDLSDGLARYDKYVFNDIPTSLPKSQVIEIDSHINESSEEEKIENFQPPNTATSLFSLTSERVTDLFQKISAKIHNSSVSQEHDATEEELNIKTDKSLCHVPIEDTTNTPMKDTVEGHETHSDPGLEEIFRVGTRIENNLAKGLKEAIDSGVTSYEEFSAPGTLTAKLFTDNGITGEKYGSIETQQIEPPLQSLFLEDIDTDKLSGENNTSKTSDLIQINDSEHDDLTNNINKSWKVKSKFVQTPKNESETRKKSIRKVLFSSLSLESFLSSSESQNLKGEDTTSSRLSWSKSILRGKSNNGKSLEKKRRYFKFNMDSGESLEGYAAEYASQNDLKMPDKTIGTVNDIVGKVMETRGDLTNRTPVINRPLSASSALSRADTIDSLLSPVIPRSLSGYIPTPLPKPLRRKSLFFGGRSNLGILRSKTYGNDRKNTELSIRFAPTPEYVKDSRILKKSIKLTMEDPLEDNEYNESSHHISSMFKKFIGN